MPASLPKEQDEAVAEATRYAVIFHQRGMLAEAEQFYAAILEIKPDHFDALRLLGVLRQQQGKNAEALRLINAALKMNDNNSYVFAMEKSPAMPPHTPMAIDRRLAGRV